MPQRSPCPIATTLDIIGDKWTLLIVRDLLLGKKTYSALQAAPEGIPTNILANRLKKMQENGLIDKTPYQDRPPRYHYRLTRKGKELAVVIKPILRWAKRHLPETEQYVDKPANPPPT